MNLDIISFDECTEIIKKLVGYSSSKVEVIDYNVTSYSDGYPGFLGEYFSLTIRFQIGRDESREGKFFLKSLPVKNIEKRKVLENYGIFKKEASLFKHLIPKLLKYSGITKWVPVCYLARDDLLVFEDLKVTSYQTLPKHIDPDINHIKMALRALAAFHAANITYESIELRPKGSTIGEIYKEMLFETSYGPENDWCMTGIRALKTVALHRTKYGFGSTYEREIQEKFIEKVCEIFDLIESTDSTIPRVCCHRDLWKNNLMYRFEDNGDFSKPSHCLLIDFQICRFLPLTLDVIICILLSSRNHSNADECLKFYYKQLESELLQHNVKIENIMSLHDFEVSCKRFKLFPLVQQGIFWSLTNLPETFLIEMLTNDEAAYIKMCNEYRDDVVLQFMDSDEFYRETMIEAVERLIEYLFVGNGKV